MSIISSRVSSVSSKLNVVGVREQYINVSNRVYFKLPKDIKSILCNFEAGNGTKEYEKLLQLLRQNVIRDSDLAEFLDETRQCISVLSTKHELFIHILLQIQWTNRSSDVISIYKLFLQDLVCMQIRHVNTVINHLVQMFKPVEDNNAEREAGKLKDGDIERLNHIHDILHKILEVVPMSIEVLLQSLGSQFPYIIHGTYTHEVYIYALLQILNYAPQLRSDILSLIIQRLVILDVNIPREEENDEEEDDSIQEEDDFLNRADDNDGSKTENNDVDKTKTIHPIMCTLDMSMELFLKYMHEFCFVNGVLKIEKLRVLYLDLLRVFETAIFSTHASQYVQYIMFYICSFKAAVTETFTDWLWHKVTNPNVAPVLRQSAVRYISSLLATASFIPHGLVKLTMSELVKWIHTYISMEESSEYVHDNTKIHTVFYSICQAFFHLFIARYKEFVSSKNGILFLQELDILRIVTCKLNPLKMCDRNIVHNFADITSMYQLAYCYTVIENNERDQLPIFGKKAQLPILVPNFFPFESYTLQHSKERIISLFRNSGADADSQFAKKQ